MPISIVSPTGRAVQQQLQNTPPEQMQNVLNQNIGLVPFGELLAMKAQYDRMKAPPAQPASQTTVAQDMQQGLAGIPVSNVGSEAAYARGGIVAFDEGGSVPAVPMQEIVPWSAEDEAELQQLDYLLKNASRSRYSSGPFRQLPPEEQASMQQRASDPTVRKRREELGRRKYMAQRNAYAASEAQLALGRRVHETGQAPQFVAPAAPAEPAPGVAPTPEGPNPFANLSPDSGFGMGAGIRGGFMGPGGRAPNADDSILKQRQGAMGTREGAVSDEMALRERYGLGASLGDRTKQLQESQDELSKDAKRNKRESIASGFFKMAEAASRPGANFLGSAATGATAGLGSFQKGRDSIDKRRDDLQEKMFAVAQAKEALTDSSISAGSKTYADRLKAYQDAQDNYQTAKRDIDIANAQMQNARGIAGAQISATRDRYQSEEALKRMYLERLKAGDTTGAQEALTALQNLTTADSPQISVAGANNDARRDIALQRELTNYHKSPEYLMLKMKAGKGDQAAAQQIAAAELQIQNTITGGGGGLADLTPSAQPMTGDQATYDAADREAARRGR